MIHLITGGTRSGKSSYAHDLAIGMSNTPVYIATSRVLDDEMADRVERHKKDRDHRFVCVENDTVISNSIKPSGVFVIDCATLWLLNLFIDNKEDLEMTLHQAKTEIDKIATVDATVFFITNEIGMGVIAESAFTRHFVDIQGWVNQYIAKKSSQVTLMVSGIPMIVKQLK